MTTDAVRIPQQVRPDSADMELLRRFWAFYAGLNRVTEVMVAELEAGTGFSYSEFEVMMHLLNAPDGSAPMRDITDILCFSTAGTTKLVDRLVEAGVVERRTHPSDRRVTLATITPAGVDAAVRASRAVAATLRRHVVEPLGEERFADVMQAMSSLTPSKNTTGS